ncbi:MAG: HPr family phosphocarrier protein [Bacillota bacterium]|nr:HPr family phosphocarrier protein [Bacillota bacterium]
MIVREVVINGVGDLESKPATIFIQKASKYKSSIWVEKGERKANGKSLLGLMSLGLGNGSKISIVVDGDDEAEAINELERYFSSL